MSNTFSLTPCWDTSSFGHPADVSSLERSALGDHLSQCDALRGPWQALQTGAYELRGLLAGRVVTSAFVVLLMVGGAWLTR
jgi:hypothetical protein